MCSGRFSKYMKSGRLAAAAVCYIDGCDAATDSYIERR